MQVAFYGRVSTEEQAERGNISGQVEFAKNYFKLHGDREGIEGYHLYLDEGVSGSLPLHQRNGGAKLLSDARMGKFSAVYFYRLDRLARSTQIVLNTYNELETLGISIKSMTEAFDTGTPVGKFFMTLLASIAALERETILERTQMGKERKSREGCWTSGPPPFGYRIGEDKKLEIYRPEALTVELIFNLYSEGMGMVSIAKYLNARKVPTPNASKGNKVKTSGLWQAGHISVILRACVYTGKYYTMKRSKGTKESKILNVPSIISEEKFNQVKILLSKSNFERCFKGKKYMLRGIVYCGHCGLAMVGSSSGGQRFYYRCPGTVNHGQGKKCTSKLLQAFTIEQAVWCEIKAFVKSPGNVLEKLKESLLKCENSNCLGKEMDLINKLLAEKNVSRERIISLLAKGVVSLQEAERQLEREASEIISLNRRRDFLCSKSRDSNNLADYSIGQIAKTLSETIEQIKPNADLVKLLVEKVVVRTEEVNGERVSCADIYYRFRNHKRIKSDL